MPNPKKPIHIFRPGSHTAMQGQTIAFLESDLAASAAAYDPARHEAPLVIGHPDANAPAYGWVSGLAASAEGLFAHPRQVHADFAEMVASGAFKKVSASFYAPDAAANPVPGVYYLRHVGFLGAQPPSVKGLQPVEFADGEAGVVTLDFADDDTASLLRRVAELFRSLRDYFIDKEGLEKAEAIIPSWAADWLQEDAAVAAAKVDIPAYHEPQPVKKDVTPMSDPLPTPAATPAENARLQSLEAQVASFQEAQRRQHAQSVVDAALAQGRLTPALATGLVEFMASLPVEDTISFGEGDAAQSVSPTAFMSGFLAALPRQVDYAEHSADTHVADGLSVQDAAREAICYQESMRQKGITITVTDAVAAVKAGKHKA